MGTQSVADYCREIEAHLCQKNDGHLIRVTGPSFDLVSGWATRGVPLKVALEGIDRYFERYYRNGPRRRPVKIDFCEADVLDVFELWRKAVGIGDPAVTPRQSPAAERRSLPAHLERVVTRLTSLRASGALGTDFDGLIDRVARELETARAASGGVRGDARTSLLERLAALDAELVNRARELLDSEALGTLAGEADAELQPFRAGMTPDAFARARHTAIERLMRDRLGLPTIAFT